MRALLVVNPAATTASRRTRQVLTAALDSDLKLDVVRTQHRGHGCELAWQARLDGLDLVVVLGGDGTVNEVVNGLLGAAGPHESVPHLGVVPGGGTNVFARALQIPHDPVEATGALLDALRRGRRRTIGLGQADQRWFTFCAGMGLDAEVVAAVDRRRRAGSRVDTSAYIRTSLSTFFRTTDRREPALTVETPDRPPDPGVHLAIIANTAPWTYLGDRPLVTSPRASFDSGLDVYGLHRLRTASTLRQVRQILAAGGRGPHGRQVLDRHDLPELTIRASRPVDLQVDGEPLGERKKVTFRSVPNALRVLA